MDIKPPIREVERNRNYFPHVVGVATAIAIAAVFFLQNAKREHPTSEPVRQIPRAQLPQAVPDAPNATNSGNPRSRHGAVLPKNCGYVNNQYRCLDEPATPAVTMDSYAAVRAGRASEIMGETRRDLYKPPASSFESNTQLRAAEYACSAAYKDGSVAYRRCRADQWQSLRKACIRERQNDVYDGDFCEAERRFQIVQAKPQ